MTKKCHENSGCCCHAVFIVMCAILRVVAYFLSDMYTLSVRPALLCVAPTLMFNPLPEIVSCDLT